ncbi:MAG: hypothetical protein AABX83_01515 [Nanoarchaeota archaeon]
MKNKILASLFIMLFFGVVIFIFLIFHAEKKVEETENNVKLTQVVLNFTKDYNDWIDFDNPSITCISEKKCNGTFIFSLSANLEENKTDIENFLYIYGNVTGIYIFDYYSISFETDNLNNIEPILNSSFFSNVRLSRIESDLKLTSFGEDFNYCKENNDCVKVVSQGCLGGIEFINKKYEKEVREYYNIKNWGIGCTAVVRPPSIRIYYETTCLKNKCDGVFNESIICNSFSNNLPFFIEEQLDEAIFSDSNLTPRDIKDMCSDG